MYQIKENITKTHLSPEQAQAKIRKYFTEKEVPVIFQEKDNNTTMTGSIQEISWRSDHHGKRTTPHYSRPRSVPCVLRPIHYKEQTSKSIRDSKKNRKSKITWKQKNGSQITSLEFVAKEKHSLEQSRRFSEMSEWNQESIWKGRCSTLPLHRHDQ